MEAPNKIYLNFPKIQPGLDNATWDTKQYGDCINVEYLRKDALLEWVNNVRSSRRNTGDDYFIPAIAVLNDLIDKLNSI